MANVYAYIIHNTYLSFLYQKGEIEEIFNSLHGIRRIDENMHEICIGSASRRRRRILSVIAIAATATAIASGVLRLAEVLQVQVQTRDSLESRLSYVVARFVLAAAVHGQQFGDDHFFVVAAARLPDDLFSFFDYGTGEAEEEEEEEEERGKS